MADSLNTPSSHNAPDLILPDPSPTMPDEIKQLDDIPSMCFKHAKDLLNSSANSEKLNYGREAHVMEEPFKL